MKYQNVSFFTLKKYLKKRGDIIIPFGSVEFHGKHLPYGTDTFALSGILEEFSKKSEVIVAPMINYTITRLMENNFGTATLDFKSAKNYFLDIFLSFAKWGFKKIYPITYHASIQHLTSISEAARQAQQTFPKLKFTGIHLWNILRKRGRDEKILTSPQEEVHAGEIETSLMLYFKPELVQKINLINQRIRKNNFDFINPFQSNSAGVYGQAKLVSVKKGEKLVKLAVEELLKIIK